MHIGININYNYIILISTHKEKYLNFDASIYLLILREIIFTQILLLKYFLYKLSVTLNRSILAKPELNKGTST